MPRGKTTRSYLPYPTTPEERETALGFHLFAIQNNLQRPQFIDENNVVHRWDPKDKTKDGQITYGLINTNLKLARNARDRARRLDRTLTADDFEAVFPGKGAALFKAEKDKLTQIYAETSDLEDVDHIWSLGSGGLHASRNLRALLSTINRSEGDRGAPSPEMQNAYMLSNNKRTQIALQGPQLPRRAKLIKSENGAIALELEEFTPVESPGIPRNSAYKNGNGLRNGNGYAKKLNGGAPVGTNTPGSFNNPAIVTGSVFEDQNPLFDFVKNSEFGGGTPKDTSYGRGV